MQSFKVTTDASVSGDVEVDCAGVPDWCSFCLCVEYGYVGVRLCLEEWRVCGWACGGEDGMDGEVDGVQHEET